MKFRTPLGAKDYSCIGGGITTGCEPRGKFPTAEPTELVYAENETNNKVTEMTDDNILGRPTACRSGGCTDTSSVESGDGKERKISTIIISGKEMSELSKRSLQIGDFKSITFNV